MSLPGPNPTGTGAGCQMLGGFIPVFDLSARKEKSIMINIVRQIQQNSYGVGGSN